MGQPLHPIFVDLVTNAAAPRMPANLRLDEIETATHQTTGPIWLGERPAYRVVRGYSVRSGDGRRHGGRRT